MYLSVAGPTAAVATGFGALYGAYDHGHCTAYATIYGDSVRGAVSCAGSAFHACIAIDDNGALVLHIKDPVRTDLGAQGATDTLLLVKDESHYTWQVSHHWFIRSQFSVPTRGVWPVQHRSPAMEPIVSSRGARPKAKYRAWPR